MVSLVVLLLFTVFHVWFNHGLMVFLWRFLHCFTISGGDLPCFFSGFPVIQALMDPAWRQRGRGRGQPRGAVGSEVRGGGSSQSRFEEIRRSDQAAARRLTTEPRSSSSEDEEEDDVSEEGGKRGKILQSALSPYSIHSGTDLTLLSQRVNHRHMRLNLHSGRLSDV